MDEVFDRTQCMSSVVLVRDNADPDAYCTGCLMVTSKVIPGAGNKTLIITSAEFVQGREHNLNVIFWFSRGQQLSATVVRTHEAFALISVNFIGDCQAIDLIEDDIVLDSSRCFLSVPLDRTLTHFIFGYATCDSLESYEVKRYRQLVPNSMDYFTISCEYLGKTATGLNRLTGAPVFVGDGAAYGRVRGIIFQDLRNTPGSVDGRRFKVALTASHLRRVWEALNPLPGDANALTFMDFQGHSRPAYDLWGMFSGQRGAKRKRGKKAKRARGRV